MTESEHPVLRADLKRISCYILTHNSALHLDEVLRSISDVVDDLVIVDSGSKDDTINIANRYNARVLSRRFDDFTNQRKFAVSQCNNDWVLSIDSDEVVSVELAGRLNALRLGEELSDLPTTDAYAIRRDWYVMRKRVHCFYPSRCPDFPVRLFHRTSVRYIEGRHVHESMEGFRKVCVINEPLQHYTCDSIDEMYAKINLYTTLAACDIRKKRRPSWASIAFMPFLVSCRWYLLLGAWKDGAIGVIHAIYVAENVYQKHVKARYDFDP